MLLMLVIFGCNALAREMVPEGLVLNQKDLFKSQYNITYKNECQVHNTGNEGNVLNELEYTNFEESVDWRTMGAVTPVKDQGKELCNAGWAFGTTGVLEAHWKINTGNLISLSEQNLLDCSKYFGNSCSGGSFSQALQYVILNDGIDTEASYPYLGRELRCRFTEENVGAKAKNSIQIKRGSESDLKNVIQNIGPVAAMIDASQPDFQNPSEGIYDNPSCSQTNPTHTVLVVGYGNEEGKDYWLVKNSWGSSWGENGYIRMSRNKNNQCGIANFAYYPIIDNK